MELNNFGNLTNKKITNSEILNKCAESQNFRNFSPNNNSDKVNFGNTYSKAVQSLFNELEETKKEQGLIGKVWDGFKNLTHVGAGSFKAEKAIKQFQKGEIDEKTAKEKLEKYKDGQNLCLDVVADLASGIIAVGAFAAAVPTGGVSLLTGLGISTAVGSGLKVGIKGLDSKLNGREYDAKNALYDAVTGGVNGLFAPITNGLGSSLTKTIGCKLGLEVGGDLVNAGAKTTLKNLIINQSIDITGGTAGKRALALGAGMALDGALGGTADNTARAVLDGQDSKQVAQSAFQGFLGGLIMSPLIGGGLRLAGKAGKKLGKNIFNKNALELKSRNQPKIDNFNPDAQNDINSVNKLKKLSAFDDSNANRTIDTAPGPKTGGLDLVVSDDVNFTNKKQPAVKNGDSIDAVDVQPKPKTEFSTDVVDNLRKSIDKIPQTVEEKEAFLIKFFQTDLKSGAQKPFKPGSYENSLLEETVDELMDYCDDDLQIVLEHSLRMSELANKAKINLYLEDDVDIYKNIKRRNIYSLVEQRKAAVPGDFAWVNMQCLAELSDEEYNKVYNLIQRIGINDKDINFSELFNFARKTDQSAIDYMFENNLFDPKNLQPFSANPNYFTKDVLLSKFCAQPLETIKKMNERALLRGIPERDYIDFDGVLLFANALSDEEWTQVLNRGLLSLKTNTGSFLDCEDICNLAELNNEAFARIKSRDLINKVGNCTYNLKNLAELDDIDWQKILNRKIGISEIDFSEKNDLAKLLAIPNEKWAVAQERGLTFKRGYDYDLLELTDENWKNFLNRNPNAVGDDFIDDVESKIRISKLTDSEFENVQKRGLVNESFGKPSFDEEGEMLAKCSDSEYSLYCERGIGKIRTTVDVKRNLLDMTDEQYKKVADDIVVLVKKYKKMKNARLDTKKFADISQYYKLAYLDENEYELAKQFWDLKYLGSDQFNFDELSAIIKLKPQEIERLKNILSSDVKFNCKNSTLIKLAQFDLQTFDEIIQSKNYLSAQQIENYIEKNTIKDVLNSEAFAKNKDLILKINDSKLSKEAKNELVNRFLGFVNNDYSYMNLREKMKQITVLQEAQTSEIFNGEEANYLNIDREIYKLQESIKRVIAPADVSKESVKRMMRGFFANNNDHLDDLLSSFNFGAYGKEGLPLKYSRKSFIKDLNSVFENLSEEQQSDIAKKMGITLNKDGDKITGYDGIIDLSKLSNEGVQGRVNSLVLKFIKENSFNTGNKELDDALNSLIQGMPEFINVIGKQQHKTHDFSLDIHILSVLKDALADPRYKNLTNDEKFCLKFAVILHDIAKSENMIDDGHASLCALYARDILNKNNVKMSDNTKDRIYELIKNHHWLADYNTKTKTADEVAVLFRRDGDLAISQIMAEADLKNVSADGSFYKNRAAALNEPMQMPINKAIDRINSRGQMFFTNKIIDKSKLPTIEYKGKQYRVINFSELGENADLSQFGFEPGTTTDNLRLFIHTVKAKKIGNLENVYHLSDPSNQGFLCASYVSAKNCPTFHDNKFGVSLASENVNVANAAPSNQSSGGNKNLSRFVDIVAESDEKDSFRTLIPNYIKKKLNITDNEYSELYSKIQKYQFVSQLDNVNSISVGNKTFSGKQIKKAILEADDLMIKKHQGYSKHNEANLYIPKTNAVVAKVDNLDEVPQNLLDFAQKYDLPIYLLGK